MKASAITVEDLSDQIKQAYNPSPEVHSLDYVPDVKRWMELHIPPLTGHSEPHQFKIEKNGATDGVQLSFRKWSTSKRWLPDLDAAKDDNEKDIVWLESSPKGSPTYVSADLNSILGSLKSDIPKYGCIFTTAQKQWWNAFLEKQEVRQSKGTPEGPWLLKDLKKCKLDLGAPKSLLTEQDEEVHEDLEKRYHKERKEPKVFFIS